MKKVTSSIVEYVRYFPQEYKYPVWQYIMDHSKISPSGNYVATLIFRNKDDLWRRIYARAAGNFKRVDVEKMEDKMKHLEYFSEKAHQEHMSKVIQQNLEGNDLVLKLKTKLYQYLKKQLFTSYPDFRVEFLRKQNRYGKR